MTLVRPGGAERASESSSSTLRSWGAGIDASLRVLCVDDDPAVLRATRRVLATRFNVTMAIGGLAALDAVRGSSTPFAVVVTDLSMPELSGIGLLQCVRQHSPETARVLLTGRADVTSAIDAVNAGEVFRFLTKPCPPESLLDAVADACAHHQKLVAALSPSNGTSSVVSPDSPDRNGVSVDQRVLKPQSQSHAVDGYVTILDAMLAQSRPSAMDCARRLGERVGNVLEHVHLFISGHVKAAALLSQLGSVGVPVDVTERIYSGSALSADDRACANRIRLRSADLLTDCPDLSIVRSILLHASTDTTDTTDTTGEPLRSPPDEDVEEVRVGGRVLDIALMLDEIERIGAEPESVARQIADRLAALERDTNGRDALIVEGFRATAAEFSMDRHVRVVRLREAHDRMVLAADAIAPNGLLLARKGQRISEILSARNASWSAALMEQAVQVIEEN